ncbi:hypothetical protein D3C76_1043830 [compost metagenome]
MLVGLDDVVEQVVVGEDRGEQLAVVIAAGMHHRLAVEVDTALLRGVQTEQQLDQGGFAATVFTDDENDLALFDAQVHRAETKRCQLSNRWEAVGHIDQFQAVDLALRQCWAVEQQVRLGRGKLA